METAKVEPSHHEDKNLFEDGRFSRSDLLEQLERIVRSKHFRNSKRYPAFLRFVVEQTLAGKTEGLKERTLGVDVFARPSHYDTNEDPIVRVTAGEIRKRIAQDYQEPVHEQELRIDLPSGSPALIVIGVHSLDDRGQDEPTKIHASSMEDGQENMLAAMVRSDMVPVSDIVSYSEISDLLTRRTHVYRTKGSADTTFEDLRQGPVILIGGLDNVWTKRLVASLRYSFFASTQLESEIRDSKDRSHAWKFDNMQLVSGDSRDYAIVASYFDSTIGQHVLVVAGIGKAGTQAAAEFVTSNQDLKSWLTEEKVPRGKNVKL